MLAFHIRPISSSGNRPAARSWTSMPSLRFWPMIASILPSLALSSTRRVSAYSRSTACWASRAPASPSLWGGAVPRVPAGGGEPVPGLAELVEQGVGGLVEPARVGDVGLEQRLDPGR